jgi:excisionase family DNA binding protein
VIARGESRADDRPLASIEEVASYLGVPVATLYRWRSRREGPPGFRIGRHVRFRWADVETWVTEQLQAEQAAAREVRTLTSITQAVQGS